MRGPILPLCVDLDGTLIEGDVTLKVLKIYIKLRFFNIFVALFWLLRGRAYFKHKLAESVELDAASLKYNRRLLEFILKKKGKGHPIFLATACNHVYADKVADYLGIFDGVFASDDRINLRAAAKAQALIWIFGRKGFIYVGNSEDDVHVWKASAECILVSPTKTALYRMRKRKYLLFEQRT
ncbi:MAG: hypothetical protein LBF54_03780 [Holosporaceae bacterium]|jgi:phosphoserine phosphatase|nr:hypothetical protein [Holosporaceae bacterium]